MLPAMSMVLVGRECVPHTSVLRPSPQLLWLLAWQLHLLLRFTLLFSGLTTKVSDALNNL